MHLHIPNSSCLADSFLRLLEAWEAAGSRTCENTAFLWGNLKAGICVIRNTYITRCTKAHVLYQTHTRAHTHFKASWQQKSFLAETQLSSISAKTNPSVPVDTIFILAIAVYTNLFTLLIDWWVFFVVVFFFSTEAGWWMARRVKGGDLVI